jgi:membrane protein required for colicin V production
VAQIESFNWIDIAISVTILVSFLFGLWRGLVREVFALVTWIAALVVARVYSDDLTPYFTSTFDGETTRIIAAFVSLFLVTLMVGALVSHLLVKLVSIAGLRLTDRLLGGVFGIARGGLLVMLSIFVAGNYFSDTLAWQESQLIPYGREAIEWSRIFIDDLSVPGVLAGAPPGDLTE